MALLEFEDISWNEKAIGGTKAFLRAALVQAKEQFQESDEEEDEDDKTAKSENLTDGAFHMVYLCPCLVNDAVFLFQEQRFCKKRCSKCLVNEKSSNM